MSPAVLVGGGGAATLLLMAGLWVWHLRSGNAAIVDVGWAASLAMLAGLYGALGAGAPWRRAVIAAMVMIWGLRLAGFLLVTRVIRQPEDARYADLRRRWGRTCRHGLWRYSRHPNYFFEWMMWVSYAMFALASPYGVVGLVSPAVMLYLLFRVTGIPATEAQALRTKGEDYRRYQETTSVFIPWRPRR